MQRSLRRAGIAAAVATVCLVAASSAWATATTIGSTFTGAFPAFSAPSTFLAFSTGTTSPHYVVPAGGTKITSFSLQASSATGAQVQLKVLRKGSTGKYTVIGQSIAETLKPSVLNTFATSIAVKPGDTLGMAELTMNAPVIGSNSSWSASDHLEVASGNVGVGQTYNSTSESPGMYRLNVKAVVQLAPVITHVSPASGPTAGHTTVTITGSHFTGTTHVYFGTTSSPALSFHVVSDTSMTAVSPAHVAGTVDIRALTPGGYSAITTADRFTY